MTSDRASPRQRDARAAARLLVFASLVALLLSSLSPPVSVSSPGGPSLRASSPPRVLVLQPDGPNGTDTSVLDFTPAWNYGDNPSLWVGEDPVNGTVWRSLLKFDLSAIPANATIVNATMELYQYAGEVGAVRVRLASAPWTEGPGERSWTRIPVTVREIAGVRRTGEPVGVSLSFPPGSIADPAWDLRMFLGSTEVPSQAYRCSYAGGRVTGCRAFFGASMAPWSTVVFNATTGANSSAVPGYRAKGMGSTPLWTAGPVGTGASGVSVVDLDGDGGLDVVFGTSDGYVRAVTGRNVSLWATQLSSSRSIPVTPQVADIDRDGRMDVIALTNDPSLVRLNRTGGTVWTTAIAGPDQPYSTPTLLDVNGDGVLDVLVGGRSRRVDAFNGTDGALLRSYPAGDWTYTASVLDVEGDGVGELFFGSDDSLVHAYNASGSERWAWAPPGTQFIDNSVALGDVDNDGYPDVVTGDNMLNGLEFALNATDGSIVWSRTMPNYREGGQTLADLNGDGTLETIVGLYSGAMYALDGRTGSTVWAYPGGTTSPAAPAVVDVNNDGSPEILYLDRGGSVVRVLDSTGALVHSWTVTPNDPGFRTTNQKLMATPAVADIDGDGTLEVVVPTGSGVQAFATGGLAHDWRTFGYNWNHTHSAYDGNSPDGAPFLEATAGAADFRPARGASWDYRDGSTPWLTPGGDFGGQQATATGAPGWVPWNITTAVADWYRGATPNVGFFLWGGAGASFGWHAFYSSDAPVPARRPRLTITYTTTTLDPFPRFLGRVPDLVMAEDSPPLSRDLSLYAADDDSPLVELRWNLTGSDPGVVLVTGLNVPGNHALSFYPRKDAWGDMRVTYWLTDLQGHTSRQDAWINLTPVNDPPDFNPPATLVVKASTTYTFDFGPYVVDVDNPPSQLTLTSDDPVHAAVSGLNVSFLYPASYLNQWVFVGLIASDGALSSGKVVAVKVTSDDPPVLVRLLPDVTIMEGALRVGVFDLDDYFRDPNNDALFFSFGYSHLNITIHANHSVDIRAESHWTGVETVTFRGVDPEGAIAEDTILVTVVPVDDPPVLGPVPDLRVHYDANYTFNLDPYISDPDTPPDRINASTSSPYVTVTGHVLVLRYPASLNGTSQPLTIWISDGVTTVSRTIRVTVGDDWPPVVRVKMPDRTFLEDAVMRDAYRLPAYFNDTDSSTVYWSSGNASVLVSIDPQGGVNLSAERDWSGTERVTFRATDSLGALAEDTVWITTLPVDDAPYFGAVPTIYMVTTTAYVDLTPYLFDVDTNVSDLSLASASPRAIVVGRGLLLNYTGDTVDHVEVQVSDGLLSNTTTITVVVALPTTDRLPPYLPWLSLPILAAALGIFWAYRWRKVEWAILATNSGLLVGSVFRRDPTALDTDLITGMLTAIMNFAKASFSGDKDRELDDLTLGDRRVAIVRGKKAFLAVVYRGRTPGWLPHTMRALVTHVEARYPAALSSIVDSEDLEDIPVLLKRFVDRAWWPFLSLPEISGAVQAESKSPEAEGSSSRPK